MDGPSYTCSSVSILEVLTKLILYISDTFITSSRWILVDFLVFKYSGDLPAPKSSLWWQINEGRLEVGCVYI